MGFYIKKSKSIGPFRVNLSKSGIGVSAGVKGARISKGPRGTTIHAGSNGIYYRKTVSSKKRASSSNKQSTNRTHNTGTYIATSRQNQKDLNAILGDYPDILDQVNANVKSIGKAAQLDPEESASNCFFNIGSESITADGIAEELLSNYKSFKKARALLLVVAIVFIVFALFTKTTTALAIMAVVAAIALILRAILKVDLICELDEKELSLWNDVLTNLAYITSSGRIGLLSGNPDSSYSFGKYYTKHIHPFRQVGILEAGKPNSVKVRCNVDIFQIVCSDIALYLLPDCIIVASNKDARVYSFAYVSIERLKANITSVGYDYAADASNITHYWEHETKDNNPDLRYKDNQMYTVATYGVVKFSSPSGFEFDIAISNDKICNIIYETLDIYQEEITKGKETHFGCNDEHSDETELEINTEVYTETENPLINDLMNNLVIDNDEYSE